MYIDISGVKERKHSTLCVLSGGLGNISLTMLRGVVGGWEGGFSVAGFVVGSDFAAEDSEGLSVILAVLHATSVRAVTKSVRVVSARMGIFIAAVPLTSRLVQSKQKGTSSSPVPQEDLAKRAAGTGEGARPSTSISLLLAQLLKEQTDRLDPAMEVRDVELLVGCVQVVVRQAEAHHHAGNLQLILEVSDDRDRAAGANEYRVFLERVVQRFRSRLDVFVVGAHHACRAFAPYLNLDFDPFRLQLLDEVRVALKDVVRVLIGDQAHGDFGGGLRRNHRLRAHRGEAARHA